VDVLEADRLKQHSHTKIEVDTNARTPHRAAPMSGAAPLAQAVEGVTPRSVRVADGEENVVAGADALAW